MMTAANSFNVILDFGHVAMQGLEVFPQTPKRLLGQPIQPAVKQNSSKTIYEAIKTNLAILDTLFTITKWKESLSGTTQFDALVKAITVIRISQFLHGGYRLIMDNLQPDELQSLKSDLWTNALNIMMYGFYFFGWNKSSELFMSLGIIIKLVEVGIKASSAWAKAHVNIKEDALKTVSYVAHFAITSAITYSLYQAGTMLVKGTLAVDQKQVSAAYKVFYITFTSSFIFYHLVNWGLDYVEFQNPKLRDDVSIIGAGVAGAIGLGGSLIAIRQLSANSIIQIGKTISPQILITATAFLLFMVTKLFTNTISNLVGEDHFIRRLEDWTYSAIVAAVLTPNVALYLNLAESTPRFWRLALQITLFASGSLLLFQAWYVSFQRLILTIPSGEHLQQEWNGWVPDYMRI